MRVPSAEEMLSMALDDLKVLRADISRSQPPGGRAPYAYLQVMTLMTAVEDMRAWSFLAEPGIAPKLMDRSPEWDAEIPRAREMDRQSLDMHRQMTERFAELGGKEALQKAIDRLNGESVDDGKATEEA